MLALVKVVNCLGRVFRVRSRAICIVLLSFVLAAAAPASAESGGPAARVDEPGINVTDGPRPNDIESSDMDESLPTREALAVESASGGVSTFALLRSPAGCEGSTAYPHSSNGKIRTSNGPYASVHGRTVCDRSVSRVSAQTSIYRTRWYGEQFMELGKLQEQYVSRTSKDSTPHYYCKGDGTHTYIGYTVSKSLENGTVFSATTRNGSGGASNMNRFTC